MDAAFGCQDCCHMLVQAIRCTFARYRDEAWSTHFHSQRFKSRGRSCSWADDVDVVKICDHLFSRVRCGCALEGVLERDGEKDGSEGVNKQRVR
jgi:hypothetical protein